MRARLLVLFTSMLLFLSCRTVEQRLCPPDHQLCLDAEPGTDGFFRCVPVGEACHKPPQTIPSPSPSPEPTPTPGPSPIAQPTPTPTPVPTPTPAPIPSPCVEASPAPSCVKVEGCSSCAAWVKWALDGNHMTRLPSGLLYNPGSGRAQYLDPRTCYYVTSAGVPVQHYDRLRVDGEVCRECPPPPSPKPCLPNVPNPGTPTAGPTPGTCPLLVRWGGGLHAQMTPSHQGIPKVPTYVGNTIDFDSTARFGNAGGRGNACNDEHHNVCTVDGEAHVHTPGPDGHCTSYRKCEDPRGPIWTLLRGGPQGQPINGGWGYRIKGVYAGTVCVRIEPRPDVQDHEGQPVRVAPGGAYTESCVEVQ